MVTNFPEVPGMCLMVSVKLVILLFYRHVLGSCGGGKNILNEHDSSPVRVVFGGY